MKKYLLLLFSLLPLIPYATSTGGATPRGVNIDGFVDVGAAPGANSTKWETDEEFQGFQGQVNWYMSWDDSNLYIGRIGGDNAEGSVIYLQCSYTGSSTTVSPQIYDGLGPDFTPMGGVNFAAYLKDSYDEFRTWNGAGWSAPNTLLNPFFLPQAGGDHFEVSIPWNSITAGNGKPDNVRSVLYQVAPNVPIPTCNNNEFVYGESPWGTGLPNDGPNVGVNDGAPTSSRQPGGCDKGDSTATRWWGCYPVIGGVGSNGWIAVQPDAGNDTTICETATAFVMGANVPPGNATGTWTLIGQPGGSPAVAISDPNAPNTLVSNLAGLGAYTFVWDINYGGCPSAQDTIVITRAGLPNSAVAPPDTVLVCEQDTITLAGNVADSGYVSFWSLISGQGSISNPGSASTLMSNLGYGDNVFQYTIGGGACTATSDQVTVTRYGTIFSDAGVDQELCMVSIATLDAVDPLTQHATAAGFWDQINGPNTAVFTNPNQHNSNVSGLVTGDYDFEWRVTNGSCPDGRDTMHITVYDAPVSDAGGDQVYCSSDVISLDGNDPLGVALTASGFWSQLSGPTLVEWDDSTLYNTGIGNLVGGTYKFSWTVVNGPCAVSPDVMTLFVTELQDNGLDSIVNPDQGQSNGLVIINPPLNGNPPYMYSIDGSTFQNSTAFGGLPDGTYIATIMDNFGCIDTLLFVLKENPGEPAPIDSLFIPTGISPNADGVNDTWEIPGIDTFSEAVIEVYNIWGGLVFRSEGPYIPWNGQRNGKDLPPGNYYFIIDLKAAGEPVRKGSLTLFK